MMSRKNKIYYVTRKIVVEETCRVLARTKKEAIQNAKTGIFHEDDVDGLGDFDCGTVEKDYDYKADYYGEEEYIE